MTGESAACLGTVMRGESIVIRNISRYCGDVYECSASNEVPPAVSRHIRVTVECEYSLLPATVEHILHIV